MFAALYAAEGSAADALIAVAREFSPRIEVYGPREITLDLAGLTRLFGDGSAIARELQRTAVAAGLRARVAIAGTCTAARLLVRAQSAPMTIDPGTEPTALAPLPIDLLAHLTDGPNDSNDPNDPNGLIATLHRWGVRTLGDLARLPADDVAARLGQEGVYWQRLARGEDARPLIPAVPEERFEQAFDLEWPIEGLEPLAFVLGRLMEPLSAHLERRGRGAAVLHVRLHLVTRTLYERSLQLPAAIRDARTLRTLALLDLESNPPPAAIDRVVVAVDPTPGRVLQFSLLTRPLPSPEQLSTLMARLGALMGEERCGSPMEVDSWQPGACAMKPFAPGIRDPGSGVRGAGSGIRRPDGMNLEPRTPGSRIPDPGSPTVALRRFRFPLPARVRVAAGKPSHVATDRRGLSGGRVDTCAGPWRTSGGWWGDRAAWDRDEWDVTLSDGATYRLFRERDSDAWFIEGMVD